MQSLWPNLNFCVQFSTCRVLQAMMGWAWLAWITVSLLLGTSLFFAVRSKAWNIQLPEAWQTQKKKNKPYGDFVVGDTATTRSQLAVGRGDVERGNDADEGVINVDNFEVERWKRAVTWLQDGNTEKQQPAVASTSAV